MRLKFFLSAFVVFFTLQPIGMLVFAQENTDVSEINTLNDKISEKKKSINQISDRIDEYKKKIEQKQAQKASLSVELDLLDNRIAKTKLEKSYATSLKSVAKTIIGTCSSLGIKVEGKTPKEITAEINAGKWDAKLN